MQNIRHSAILLLLSLAILAGGCGQSSPTPSRANSKPTTVAQNEPADAPTAVSDEPTATIAPTQAPTAIPTERVKRGGGAKSAPTAAAKPTKSLAPTATTAPVAQKLNPPARFLINTPKLKVDAAVEHVTYAPNSRAMDVPKKWENVAWFEPGYVPGTKGNSVIAGHLDSRTGPAVFAHLEDIEVDDIVSVVDTKGKKIDFRVTKKQVYFDADAPILEIFGPTEATHLNLITCEGEFNPDSDRYDRKLVVFTEKVT
ncbi:MAG: sortase [Chloroflexia bacterium]|nr:sortase [Chloroflexia bacterium]